MKTPAGYELGSAFQKDITGVYYRAVQMALDRPVTMKILRDDLKSKPRALRIFLDERDIVASLQHSNLLMAMDTGTIDDRPYFITESTAEPTLAEALKAKEPLVETRAVAIALGMAQALHHLARKDLIYKNVTPKNVLLPRPTSAKLVTFRVVKRLSEAASFRSARVQSGHYCAPELTRDDLGPVTSKVNVYALGALLYHLLAGSPPLDGKSTEARAAHAGNDIEPLRQRRPFLRDRAYDLVGQLMCHDPEERAGTEAAVALLKAYASDPLVANPPKSSRRKRLRKRR